MLTLTTPPVGEPLSLPDVKAMLRLETDADDALIGRMIATARALIERRLDVALLRQSWTLTLGALPCEPVPLRPSRVIAINGGTVRYGASEPRPLTEDEFRLIRSVPARVAFDLHTHEGGERLAEIAITFDVGWPDAASVPLELVHATGLLTAHYYEERQLFAQGRYVPVPRSVDALLAAFREVRL